MTASTTASTNPHTSPPLDTKPADHPRTRSPTQVQADLATRQRRHAAQRFLETLLNATLTVTVPDGRRFRGVFKCVDDACNVVLSAAYEYPPPAPDEVVVVGGGAGTAAAERDRRRFVGLVVVPDRQIVGIEAEGGPAVEEAGRDLEGLLDAAAGAGGRGSARGDDGPRAGEQRVDVSEAGGATKLSRS